MLRPTNKLDWILRKSILAKYGAITEQQLAQLLAALKRSLGIR